MSLHSCDCIVTPPLGKYKQLFQDTHDSMHELGNVHCCITVHMLFSSFIVHKTKNIHLSFGQMKEIHPSKFGFLIASNIKGKKKFFLTC